MLIAFIVAALVAIVALILLIIGRSSAAEFRRQAEDRESALIAERDRLTEARDQLDHEVKAANTETDRLKREATKNTSEIRRLGGEIDEAAGVAAEHRARIDSQSAEIAALVGDNNDLQERFSAAELATAEAKAALAAADARNTGVVIGDVSKVDSSNVAALWELELLRSERTWRTSVAVDPSSPHGPFETADDPTRLAVEVTAAALREEVGAFITIDWQAPTIDAPARCHLVVRVAQEMLEAAARNPEPLRLVVVGGADDEIVLRLEPADADADVIKIPQPRLTDDLVVVNEAAALSVTVPAE